MKILYSVDYYQPEIGYSEYFLPHELKMLGHDVIILTSNYYFPFPNYEESTGAILGPREQKAETTTQSDGITIIKEQMKYEIFTRAIIGNHEKYLSTFKPDLVIVNKTAGWNAIRFAMLKRKYNYKLITYDAHLPSGFKAEGNQVLKEIFYFIFRLLFSRLLNKQGDAHVAVQEGTKEIMRNYYGITRPIHLPLGTDTSRFYFDNKQRNIIRKKLGIKSTDFVVIYTGKIIPTKGVHLLFSALNHLAPKISDLKVVLVGSGGSEYRNKCLSLLKSEYHNRVNWVGFKTNDELYKYYSASDVGVWPLEESTSMNDAMACKIPFIANHTLGVKKRLENNNALLYQQHSHTDLAKKIRYLYNNRSISRKMGERGYELITRDLSWSVIAKQYLKLVDRRHIHLQTTINWIIKAQDSQLDGGVAAYYRPILGWSNSFIETTGYIISSFISVAKLYNTHDYDARINRMGDFLINMQLPSGGYRTYPPSQIKQSKPTVFNTAQDIIGLSDLFDYTNNKKYLNSAISAADFLCKIQNKDGTWSTYTYKNTVNTYDSRVALSLLKIYKITKKKRYLVAATKNLDWVLSQQNSNGFFQKCSLPYPNPKNPYTHTITYVLEGLLESGSITGNKSYINSSIKAGSIICDYYLEHSYLPGTFDDKWESNDNYSCLTGDAQLAGLWFDIYAINKQKKYLTAAKRMNQYLMSTQKLVSCDQNLIGAVGGSWPIYGDLRKNQGYSRFAYVNWAAKFFVDSLVKEIRGDK